MLSGQGQSIFICLHQVDDGPDRWILVKGDNVSKLRKEPFGPYKLLPADAHGTLKILKRVLVHHSIQHFERISFARRMSMSIYTGNPNNAVEFAPILTRLGPDARQ